MFFCVAHLVFKVASTNSRNHFSPQFDKKKMEELIVQYQLRDFKTGVSFQSLCWCLIFRQRFAIIICLTIESMAYGFSDKK